MLKSLIAAATLIVAVPLAPALADNSGPTLRVQISQHSAGHRHNRRGYAHRPQINRHQAVRIARQYGLARVTDVDFDRGRWEVEGRTRRGARVEVEISARTGRVVDVDYFRRGRGYNRGARAHRRAHEDRGVTWSMTDYERSWDRSGNRSGDRSGGHSGNRHGNGSGDTDRNARDGHDNDRNDNRSDRRSRRGG